MTNQLVNTRSIQRSIENFSHGVRAYAEQISKQKALSVAKNARRLLEEGAAARGLEAAGEAINVLKDGRWGEFVVVADFKNAKALEYGTSKTLPMRFMRNALKEIFNIPNRNNLTRI